MSSSEPRFSPPLRPKLLVEWVVEELETLIFSGELLPGEKVNERFLAEHLQISRSPVREALRTLEQANLVEVVAHRGAFVRWLDKSEAADLYELRALLARRAAELSVPHLSKAQIDEMKSIAEEIDAISREGSIRRFTHLNYRFHEIVLEACGNKRLAKLYLGVLKESRLHRRQQLIGVTQQEEQALEHQRQANEEHWRIVNALQRGDVEEAVAALCYHDERGTARSMTLGASLDVDATEQEVEGQEVIQSATGQHAAEQEVEP